MRQGIRTSARRSRSRPAPPASCAARSAGSSRGGRSALRDRASARRALDEAELEQVRLVDVLDRLLLLPERCGERREADGPAFELAGDRSQQLARLAVEALLVDLEEGERLARDLCRDHA